MVSRATSLLHAQSPGGKDASLVGKYVILLGIAPDLRLEGRVINRDSYFRHRPGCTLLVSGLQEWKVPFLFMICLLQFLFDTGATHSFISSLVVRALGLTPTPLSRSLCVSSPLVVSIEVRTLCDACPIVISGREFLASLIVVPDRSFVLWKTQRDL